VDKNRFNWHLKECEFRFNNRKKNFYKILLEMFRKEPLNQSKPIIFIGKNPPYLTHKKACKKQAFLRFLAASFNYFLRKKDN
jgi:hypothetical protein